MHNTDLKWTVKTDRNTFEGSAKITEGAVRIDVELNNEILESVTAVMPYEMGPEERIFLNGYQSWTYSPELDKNGRYRGIDQIAPLLLRQFSFDRYGDYHFVKYGRQRGQSHGFSYGYFREKNNYKLIASLDEREGYTIIRFDSVKKELSFERDCAGVRKTGTFHAFELFFKEGNEDEVFDAWFKEMNISSRTTKPLTGYSSWYNRYQNISSQSIREDLENYKNVLEPGDLFQIDDGWEPFVGDWLVTDARKFPLSLKAETDAIHAAGFQAGLWLAPFVCEEKSNIFQNHKDWLLKVNGEPWKLGCNWSGFYSLDIDHPEVQKYIKDVFDRVFNEWNFDLVKLDFLYGAAPFGNEKESRAARMYRAMEMVRELCGDKLILGCGVPLMPVFGLVDYCRIGCDVSLDWDDVPHMRLFHRERISTKQSLTNTLVRRHLNNRAFGNDPDVFFLRYNNIRMLTIQKRELATVNALLGNVFLTSDNKFSDRMLKNYKKLRHLALKAEDIHVTMGKTPVISYTLDGEEKKIKVYGL